VKVSLVIWFIFLSALAYGQTNRTGTPVSWNQQLSLAVNQEWVAEANVDNLLEEDVIQEDLRTLPYRFAYARSVSWTMENSGSWINLENGDRLWILGIEYERARSISVSFEHLHLPSGAKLFAYSEDRHDYYGPINGAYAIETELTLPHILGQRMFLEYYEPRAARGEGRLKVNYVSGAYREPAAASTSSQLCTEWLTDGSSELATSKCGLSVMRVLVDHGQRYATSFLINNSQNSAMPYAVMASSSIIGPPSSFSFQIGLNDNRCLTELSSCDLFCINGAELVCRDSIAGLTLIRLSDSPPAEEGVYYAGWNVGDLKDDMYYCVQHPLGMAKSFAQYQGSFLESPSVMPLAVGLHNNGVGETCEGSVGSPLFDADFKVVGVFLGGNSRCESPGGIDHFVLLKEVWSSFKVYLDPLQTGDDKIPGRETIQQTRNSSNSSEFIVYPNPASHNLQIVASEDFDVFRWEVYDTYGRLQLCVNSLKTLDISSLTDGVYSVKAYTSRGVMVTPLLISKK
jgi:hypothetical protein